MNLASSKSSIFSWNLQPQLFTIIITTVIILVGVFLYWWKLRKLSYKEAPKGYVLLCERFIGWVEDTVIDITSPKFRWLTPYIIFLLLYLGIGNLLSLIGLSAISTSYTVIFALGIVTLAGMILTGIFFQRLKYILKFIYNPLEILNQFAPFISLTFRIFGNLIAGTMILYLIYLMTGNIYAIKLGANIEINFLAGFIAPPFHFYFDIFDGIIQTFIFVLLTLSYIGMEAIHEEETKVIKKSKKSNAKAKLGSYYEDKNVDIVRHIE
ncbi:F0F1 ATP synthase subunit A [Mycoplasma sp. SG1]|uniref:F0F1 ATP synthase subunit A n=1 Tax=Mycoplasma sp. SG1 TaxID=2810348 RepID=UPI002023CBC6|nr:F0F1 ATP synthase subunit A [Mycoplasma sp. SG1]URM52968.1 F0F1 ATP synthase subunit A [Mycoplasma sp. SG1]